MYIYIFIYCKIIKFIVVNLFQLLVPRQSYFPLVTDKVTRHFQKFVNQEKQGEMWLEDESQPLKW